MNPAEVTFHPLIIPTVVIPFTALLAALSALATFIAGLFGLKLKAEGPKRLLEVMLKPRVLVSAVVMNFVFYGGYKAFQYWRNAPVLLWRVEAEQRKIAVPSPLDYSIVGSKPAGFRPSLPGKIEVAWTREIGKGSFRGAVLAGDAAFIAADDGYVYELNTANGEIRRRFFLGTAVSAAPLIYRGSLYAGEGTHDVHHARLYKFNLASGALEGTFTGVGHIEGEPVADTGNIVIPDGSGGVMAIDSATLQKRWSASDGHFDSAAVIVDGVVFVGSGLEKENQASTKPGAFAYDLDSGKKLWQRQLPASSWMKPFAWRDKVCFVLGEVYFHSDLGGIFCFHRKDGTPDVSYNNAAPIVAEASVIEDDAVTSDLHGKICRVSLLNGIAKWCRETGTAKSAFANAIYDESKQVLVYPSENSGLFVLDAATGQILLNWKGVGEKMSWAKTYAPAAAAVDGWIISDMKGNVRKIRWVSDKTDVTRLQSEVR